MTGITVETANRDSSDITDSRDSIAIIDSNDRNYGSETIY